ncbi:hypothetical protein JJP91_14210 [Enterobacter hormaechei]|uniref:hypothetical protein n=1 Tax=Enterobacter hormaechei TaxID=158836 RepID=UPI000DCEEFBF|nr:hypothetical protein [Enterobacter hormaechei]MBK4264042.1 hypothetical protein [Enterobacter hormaechei]RAZ11683.1 hypothetical protein DP198_17440 [Enterobacter hormaechei]
MKHTVEVMIPEAEIKARIAELGRQITEHYKDSGSEMVLVGLLRGSFMFMADLCREVQVPVEFVGFSIPDEFVVGYGIDYAQRYRHLPYVGKVVILDE